MPVQTYVFKVDLLDSRDPQIWRAFSVPSSWTFQKFHAAIQHVFSWQNEHVHVFTFQIPLEGGRNKVVSIQDTDMLGRDDEEDGPNNIVFDERTIKLNDIWEEGGRYRREVTNNATLGGCFYEYDFGVSGLASSVMSRYRRTYLDRMLGSSKSLCCPSARRMSKKSRFLMYLVVPLSRTVMGYWGGKASREPSRIQTRIMCVSKQESCRVWSRLSGSRSTPQLLRPQSNSMYLDYSINALERFALEPSMISER
jgi:hypothetical protein